MPHKLSPRRYSLRLKGYDYSQAGAYFITVCTQRRALLFGDVVGDDVRLNHMGAIVNQAWVNLPDHYPDIELDAFIVMPNHVYGILILSDEPKRRHAIPKSSVDSRRFLHRKPMSIVAYAPPFGSEAIMST